MTVARKGLKVKVIGQGQGHGHASASVRPRLRAVLGQIASDDLGYCRGASGRLPPPNEIVTGVRSTMFDRGTVTRMGTPDPIEL